MYRPLPKYLTIKNSKIEGLGLFATQDIKEAEELGVSHYYIEKDLIRTPLGGFYNHSQMPNCYTRVERRHWDEIKNEVILITCRAIKKGEEITTNYQIAPLD